VIIDPIDLKLIRLLELQGNVPITDVIGKFQITEKEILLRIDNMEESGFINGYGLKLFIPSISGGRWYWGCVACETTRQFKPERSVACLEEIVSNTTTPAGFCPDHSLLFYTQNLREAYTVINKSPGVRYAEIYKIGTFNVKIPQVLLKEDWKRILGLHNSLPNMKFVRLHQLLHNPESGEDIALSRLMWRRMNKQGVVSIFPNFDWSVIKNYLHLHVAVTSKLRVKELRRIVNKLGCSGNITSRFKKRYMQLWGFTELHNIYSTLQSVKRISIEGCSFAYKNRVYDGWIKKFIESKI
jgi:DNA-binding Lrp family transcriptional regulator